MRLHDHLPPPRHHLVAGQRRQVELVVRPASLDVPSQRPQLVGAPVGVRPLRRAEEPLHPLRRRQPGLAEGLAQPQHSARPRHGPPVVEAILLEAGAHFSPLSMTLAVLVEPHRHHAQLLGLLVQLLRGASQLREQPLRAADATVVVRGRGKALELLLPLLGEEARVLVLHKLDGHLRAVRRAVDPLLGAAEVQASGHHLVSKAEAGQSSSRNNGLAHQPHMPGPGRVRAAHHRGRRRRRRSAASDGERRGRPRRLPLRA